MQRVLHAGMAAVLVSCSFPSGRSDVHIVNGYDVSAPDSFVSLFSSPTGTDPWCGGTYIGDGVVVTAAHCPYLNNARIWAAFGANSMDEFHVRPKVEIRSVRIHEGFNSSSIKNDIALLFVDSANLSRYDHPLVPARMVSAANDVASGELVNLIGFGNTSSFGWMAPRKLQGVTLPVVSEETCRKTYGDIGSDQLCAGLTNGGQDTCQGDSGGPLFKTLADGSSLLAGLVSFGNGCAQPGTPGVYTRVSAFSAWISSTIAAERAEGDVADPVRVADTYAAQCYDGLHEFFSLGAKNPWQVARHLWAGGPFEPVVGLPLPQEQPSRCVTRRELEFSAVELNGIERILATSNLGQHTAPVKSLYEIEGDCLVAGDQKGHLSLSDNWSSLSFALPNERWSGYPDEVWTPAEGMTLVEGARCVHDSASVVLFHEVDTDGVPSGRVQLRVNGVRGGLEERAFVVSKEQPVAPVVEAKLTRLTSKRSLLKLTNLSSETIYGVEWVCDRPFRVMTSFGKSQEPEVRGEKFVQRFAGLHNLLARVPSNKGHRTYVLEWMGKIPSEADEMKCVLNESVKLSLPHIQKLQ